MLPPTPHTHTPQASLDPAQFIQHTLQDSFMTEPDVCVVLCVCVCVCVGVCCGVCVWCVGMFYVVYEDTNLYNDMGMT